MSTHENDARQNREEKSCLLVLHKREPNHRQESREESESVDSAESRLLTPGKTGHVAHPGAARDQEDWGKRSQQHWQVDQEMSVPGVDSMLCKVARHQVVHDEVEGGQLPVVVAHSQVPELPEGELTVVQRVCEEEDGAGHESDRDQRCDPEVEDLERSEHGLVGNPSLEPEEKWNKSKEDKGWPIENPNRYQDSNGEDKLEIMRWDNFSLLLDFNSFANAFRFLVAVLDQLLQVDSLICPLHGVCHHVQQQGGHHQLQGVAEGPRGVDNHHIAGGKGGEALVVAVFVQLADLVDTGVHCEGKQEHDKTRHQLNDVRPNEDLNAKLGMEEKIKIFESADRDAVEQERERGTAQGGGDVELPCSMRVKFENIA